MLHYDASEFGLQIRTSSIRNAGKGVFASTRKKCGNIVGYFSGTIIPEDISMRTSVTLDTKFGLRDLENNYAKFRDYACQTEHDLPAFIVPNDYCVAAKINDSCSFFDGHGYESSRRHGNVELRARQDQNYDDLSHYGSTYAILRDRNGIEAGEELLVKYGKEVQNGLNKSVQ